MTRTFHQSALSRIVALVLAVAPCLTLAAAQNQAPAQNSAIAVPRVEFKNQNVGPRELEALTGKSITRDYTAAWKGLADALDHDAADMLGGYFVGVPADQLRNTIIDQKRTGVHSRYRNQSHVLEAVFYSPEGDVMELHDTMQCDLQVMDGDKTLHQERATLHYVVLMTPAADRWVIRQLQSVSRF
jgi:hypothetical protein